MMITEAASDHLAGFTEELHEIVKVCNAFGVNALGVIHISFVIVRTLDERVLHAQTQAHAELTRAAELRESDRDFFSTD